MKKKLEMDEVFYNFNFKFNFFNGKKFTRKKQVEM